MRLEDARAVIEPLRPDRRRVFMLEAGEGASPVRHVYRLRWRVRCLPPDKLSDEAAGDDAALRAAVHRARGRGRDVGT